MKHPLSENLGVRIPQQYLDSDTLYWIVEMSRDGLAHCKTWHEKAIAYHEFIDHKLPDQELSHKYARYLILYDVLSDGTGVFLEYPTRNGWNDFIWSQSKPFLLTNGLEKTKISYYEVAEILWTEKNANPVGFEPILQQLYQYSITTEKPNPKVLNAYKTVTDNDLEYLFAAVGVGYLEQCNKNSKYLHMRMSWGLYPPSREMVREQVDMCEGKLLMFYSLHGALEHHMPSKTVISAIRKHWKYSPKDKSHGTLFYEADGYFSGVNGPAHIVFTRTKKELIFALGFNNANIWTDSIELAPGELRVHIREERYNQASIEFWFQNDIKPFADSCSSTRANFEHGYVQLDGNGRATVCLYQDWTEDDIVKTIKRQQKIAKHKLEG